MSDAAIRVEQLGKRYQLGASQAHRDGLRHILQEKFSAPWRRFSRRPPVAPERGRGEQETEFWALRDLSFEIKQGDVVGIVGRNGAGKSTLLKILSRITEPTTGRITIEGRVASLLEVGTGFHAELTGRENIFLNGAILGMSRTEIALKFDEIVAFAEVERFLDTPVKRYSSGMYVRLAFAVAAHLEPEILIVDEVLAVGDSEFQRKCLGKMKDVSTQQGRTVIFVSHNMMAVRRLCNRGILLQAGRIVAEGDAHAIAQQYQSVALPSGSGQTWTAAEAPGSDRCRLRSARITDTAGEEIASADVRRPFIVEAAFDVLREESVITPNFHFHDQEGLCLFIAQDLDPEWRGRARPVGRHLCRLFVDGNLLAPGYISVGVALTTYAPFQVHCFAQEAIGVLVEESSSLETARGDYTGPLPGAVRPLLKSTNEFLEPASADHSTNCV